MKKFNIKIFIAHTLNLFLYLEDKLNQKINDKHKIIKYVFWFFFYTTFNYYLKLIILYFVITSNPKKFLIICKDKCKTLKLNEILLIIFLFIFTYKFNFKIFYFIPGLGIITFILYIIVNKYANSDDSFELTFLNEILTLVKENRKYLKEIRKHVR